MSQLSVPSSTITDATFADPGNLVDQQAVGEATIWEAMAEDDEASYLEQTFTCTANGISQAVAVVGMQNTTDPGIDTGHTVRILIRGTLAITGPAASATVTATLIGGPGTFTKQIVAYQAGGTAIPGAFTLVEVPFTALEVQDFRAAGGYTDCTVDITASGNSNGAGDDGDGEIQVAFVQLEVPDSVVPDVDVESDAGLEFLFTNGANVDVVSDAGLEFDFSSDIETNDIISDAGLELGGGGVESNEIVSDAGLEFDFTGATIVSADASGIYTFIPGQRYDRILARNTPDVLDINVAIPRPFGKTAFFNG